MNSFSHALPFLSQPYVAVGCFVPDVLGACDRRCRVRKKKAKLHLEESDQILADVATGVVQHHEDDRWFHRTAKFNTLNMDFTIRFRDSFGNSQSMRSHLIGHVLIEMFLDWFLEEKFPGSLAKFYDVLKEIDPARVEQSVNQFATQKTDKLTSALEFFAKERYIFDYETDSGVHYRMSRVLQRLNLDPLPEACLPWLATVREEVYVAGDDLLAEFAWDRVG